MILKELLLATVSFLIGYSMGQSDDSDVAVLVDEFIKKSTEAKQDVASLLMTVLDKIDTIESDELKANFERGAARLKEQFAKFIELEK